jgi:hypothetical protein
MNAALQQAGSVPEGRPFAIGRVTFIWVPDL